MPKLFDEPVRSNLEDIEVWLHHSTDLAWLVSTDGERKSAVWVPKSRCEMEHVRGHTWTMTAPQPVLEEKGLV
jgi:hypothetical protein